MAPTATPAWTGPDKIARGPFFEPALVVDYAGAVHLAVTRTGDKNQGIWYLTNASGSWSRRQLTTPPTFPDENAPGYDGQPAIAIDPADGSIWIAFTRWECSGCLPDATAGIFYVTNAGGTWSEPVQLSGSLTLSPSLVVRNGHIHLAYATMGFPGEARPVMYGTNASGEWVARRVSRLGWLPHLILDGDGLAHILFSASDLRFAEQTADGRFVAERLPGTGQPDGFASAGDETGSHYWAAWGTERDDSHINVVVATRVGSAWSDPITAISHAWVTDLGVYDGVVHLIGIALGADGLLYANNASGTFEIQTLFAPGSQSSVLAFGPAGQPFVVFTGDGSGWTGIWFAEGPG